MTRPKPNTIDEVKDLRIKVINLESELRTVRAENQRLRAELEAKEKNE